MKLLNAVEVVVLVVQLELRRSGETAVRSMLYIGRYQARLAIGRWRSGLVRSRVAAQALSSLWLAEGISQ